MDFTIYWFMFPVAIFVATTAMLSGIAGAALFMPVFLLGFPLLGPAYELNSPAVSVAAALITSTFGFASGFAGYYRKGLIDFKLAKKILKISLPFAIVGALVCPLIPSAGIRFFYGVLMVVLATFLLFPSGKPDNSPDTDSGKEAIIRPPEKGQTHRYASFHIHKTITALGGFLTGLLSTGIGEVVIPQLIKKGKVPVPVSAATSVAVVIGTFLVAATTHVFYLVGHDGINAIPWNLVCYTVPGVIIGGQIGPRLHGIVAPGKMVRGIALVFGLIGIMMILTVLKAPG